MIAPWTLRRPLAFDGRFVRAELVEDARNLAVEGVVTNLSNSKMIVAGVVPGVIPPWKSTTLRGGTIAWAERVSIVHVPTVTNLGGVAFDGWQWFGDRMAEFPRHTPLYISPKDFAGSVEVCPWQFANDPEPRAERAIFDIHLNLWWAPPKTDAGIHNKHEFLEIHTQIFGNGRIQIFHNQQGDNIYRELSTAPGDTHDPILLVHGLTDFRYPWHRGWTDDGCIWMAIELHPVQKDGDRQASHS